MYYKNSSNKDSRKPIPPDEMGGGPGANRTVWPRSCWNPLQAEIRSHRLRTFLHFVGTGLYTGYLPWAPGTWATLLVGVPLCIGLKYLGEFGFFVGSVAVLTLSVHSSGFVEKELGDKDPSFVVIDEIAGFLVSMILVPISVTHVACACAFFRLFDIVKPCPIRTLEKRFPGGWGITLDDILAGLYACLCVHLVSFFL